MPCAAPVTSATAPSNRTVSTTVTSSVKLPHSNGPGRGSVKPAGL